MFDFLRRKAGKVPPWTGRPSLYRYVEQHLDGDGKLPPDWDELPDADAVFKGGDLRWASGAMDGVFRHHGSSGESYEKKVGDIVSALRAIGKSGSEKAKARLYHILLEGGVFSHIDAILELLVKMQPPPEPHLRDFALWLVREAPDREPVKLGIALLGAMGSKGDLGTIATIARHEEFTVFACVAIMRIEDDSEERLWELARCVQGWGRIHVVERLAGSTKNPALKAWLLREGFRNLVMNEYLALSCAVAGELHAELAASRIDADLLRGAGEIIEALIAEGPAAGMSGYPNGAAAVGGFLAHVERAGEDLGHFSALISVREYLDKLASSPSPGPGQDWTPENIESLAKRAAFIVSDSRWRKVLAARLQAGEDHDFWQVLKAAKALGADTWEVIWRRITDKPLAASRWFEAMEAVPPEAIGGLVALAESALPLERVASGPGLEMGLGKGFEAHQCMDFILQGLRRFPGHGYALVEAGLKSPVIRNRYGAARALSAWTEAHWPPEAKAALKAAIDREPDPECRAALAAVHGGKPIDPG